jgi:steroid delta-isomerase-like uncharacterized protein
VSSENKMVVRDAIEEIWNQGNLAVVRELAASDVIVHASTLGNEIQGREGIQQIYHIVAAAFPDIHIRVDDQIAEGDKVATRWTAQATHMGACWGVAAKGQRVRVTGISISRIANGKIVECWMNADNLSVMQQIGVPLVTGSAEGLQEGGYSA